MQICLISNKTNVYGTLQLNRKGVKKAKLKPSKVCAYQRGKAMILKWKDKKEVMLFSSIHNPAKKVQTRRWTKNQQKVIIL